MPSKSDDFYGANYPQEIFDAYIDAIQTALKGMDAESRPGYANVQISTDEQGQLVYHPYCSITVTSYEFSPPIIIEVRISPYGEYVVDLTKDTLHRWNELEIGFRPKDERLKLVDLRTTVEAAVRRTSQELKQVKRSEGINFELDERRVHPNIITLIKRMNGAHDEGDYAEVLHASASIFETMAKDVVGSSVENQTLKSFFDRYRKDSTLPKGILDYIQAIYDSRNSTPLAGHGGTQTPSISREESVTLCEMTKAFVQIEYKLRAKSI